MPKTTFYRINIEKQRKIIEVGEKLFSNNIYEDVDVKMIVEAADIPRGSFYAYFTDIQDYYLTVIKALQEDRVKQVNEIKESASLSFFDVLIRLFEKDITASYNSEKKLLIQHYFRYTLTQNLGFHKHGLGTKEKPIYDVLASFQNDIQLNNSKWEDFLDLCMNTYLLTYIKASDYRLNIKDSVDLFTNRIKILERGIKWLLYHSSGL